MIFLVAYLVVAVFASYITTVVLVKGHLLTYMRCRFRFRTLWLIKGPPGDRWHLIDCRLCTGAWVSAGITIAAMTAFLSVWSWRQWPLHFGLIVLALLAGSFFVVFGGAYFLATQER